MRSMSTRPEGAVGEPEARGPSRWVRLAAAVLVIGGTVAYDIGPLQATPASQFEITDANIVDAAGAPPDWGGIFGRVPPGGATAPVVVINGAGFLATSFSEDPLSSDPLPSPPCLPEKTGDLTVFTSGGSDKNGDDIPTWTFESGSVPPSKDDLANVYAAAKKDGTDTIFYFALERSKTNGSGHVDFEFLHSPIGLDATSTDSSGCPSGHFTGSRTVGDILLSMNFDNGGTVGTEDIRLWDGDSYEAPAVDLTGKVGLFQNGSDAIDCGDWRCRGGDGSIVTELDENAFVEGFINATALGVNGCFSSFDAKSRSSHEYNSELKDFALGQFNTCDASISITPDGVNEVGTTHQLTGHVEVNPSGTFVNAPDGTVIDYAIVSGPGSFVGGDDDCTTSGGTGSCSVSITSASAGTTVVSASTSVQVGPITVQRSTNGNAGPGGSGNAVKEWVDAYVKVTPDDINPVNQQHVFTVEFGVLPGGADSVTLDSLSADVSPNPNGGEVSTCGSPTPLGGNVWQCTVTINSSTAGVFHATATGTATIEKTGVEDSVTLTRTTTTGQHGPGGNTGATKTYVDARISVGPDGLNEVNDLHTVTGTVETNNGTSGWVAAPAGTLIDFAKMSGPGSFVGGDDDCTTLGSTGACTVQITSAVVGSTVVSATTTVTVLGVPLTRSTDSGIAPNGATGGTGNLTKRWADASIRVVETDVNEVNDDHEFTITVTAHRPADEDVTFDSIVPTVSPAPSSAVSTCGSPVVAGDGLSATCTFTINSPTAGVFDVDATADVSFDDGNTVLTITRSTDPAVAPAGPSGNTGATKIFVDARVSVGPDGVNAVGDPHTVTGTAELNDGSGWQPAVGKTITFATTEGVGGFVDGDNTCVTGGGGTCTVQIVSAVPGVQWVSASTSYAVLGVTLNRTTAVDGPTDPDNLRKEWVTATIEIVPNGVNEVGTPHTFDITVTATSSGADISFGAVNTSATPTPDAKDDTCSPGERDVDGGVLTCTLTINSSTAGIFTANATAVVTIGDVVFNLATNGAGGGGPATKTYVDARISIGPDAVNEVGDPHTVTAHLEVNDGEGWSDAPEGVTIALTKLSGPGDLSGATCETDADGTCSVTLTSDTAGTTVVSASATVDVLGVPLTRSTNSNAGPGGSDNLVKEWVDAAISISPNGVNPVGAEHTFTVTVTAIPAGTGDPSFDSVTVSVTPEPDSLISTCDAPEVDGNIATCTVMIVDDEAGIFTANATAEVTMGDVTVTRSTDSEVAPSGPGGSGPAEKIYVDANIGITPDGVNAVGDDHVITGHVNVDDGTGEVNAPAGTVIDFVIESGPGALSADSCTTADDSGSCTVTLTSDVAGVTVVSASSTVVVREVTLDLATNGLGANTGNLTKRWIDASITIGPPTASNPLNREHVFTITVTAIPSGASPVTFDSITTSVTPAPDERSDTCATPEIDGDVATCTMTINSSVAGRFVANATATVSAGGASVLRSTDVAVAPAGPGGSGPAEKIYVGPTVLGRQFPRTGAELLGLTRLAGLLIATGGALLAVSQRRRRGGQAAG